MPFSVRTDRFPIVDVVIRERVPFAETEQIFAGYRAAASRGKRIALLIDMSQYDGSDSDASQRKQSVALYQRSAVEMKPATVCEARIFSSTLTRCIITAFDWLSGTPWPTAIFTSSTEAEAWVKGKLAEDEKRFSHASP